MLACLRYAWYLLRHKWYVFLECCILGVPWLGIVHDLSKLLPWEFLPYADYFYGHRRPTRSELIEMDHHLGRSGHVSLYRFQRSREDQRADFERAWLAHQHRNKHHYQHWILRDDSGETRALEMPDAYLRELIADWRGAGRAIGKPDTRAWYLRNRDHIVLAPRTRAWVERELGIE